WDLMAAALVEIVDEATQADQNSPAKLWFQCNDRDFEDDLNGMLLNLDTEDQAPIDQMKTVQRWKMTLRSKLSFGLNNQGSTGMTDQLTDPVGFQAFYNAWSLDTILWVAKPTGFEHAIEKLQGTQNIPDVYDIELLTDLFYSIIGMPRSWFGAKSGSAGGDQAMSGKALLAQDMRFLRKIKSIRSPIINCYTWLGYFHAVLK